MYVTLHHITDGIVYQPVTLDQGFFPERGGGDLHDEVPATAGGAGVAGVFRAFICDLEDGSGYLIAVDTVDAGVGERVLVLDEGNGARQIFDIATGPIRSVVVGIVDDVHEP